MRCAIPIALAITASTGVAAPYPALVIHDVIYESACVDSNWKETQAFLVSASNGKNPIDLLNLVKTWICESGARADEAVRRRAAANIRLTFEQTGIMGQQHSDLSPSSVHALGGNAWGVVVESEISKVKISCFPNEACAASGTFAYLSSPGWL